MYVMRALTAVIPMYIVHTYIQHFASLEEEQRRSADVLVGFFFLSSSDGKNKNLKRLQETCQSFQHKTEDALNSGRKDQQKHSSTVKRSIPKI